MTEDERVADAFQTLRRRDGVQIPSLARIQAVARLENERRQGRWLRVATFAAPLLALVAVAVAAAWAGEGFPAADSRVAALCLMGGATLVWNLAEECARA